MGKQIQLNKIRSDAAECQLLSSLATGEKRRIFAKIAEDLKSLAFELERTMADESAISVEPQQLQIIRSDAAECFSLSNLPNGEAGEMFAKTAEYLNNLALEVDKIAKSNGVEPPRLENRIHAADPASMKQDNQKKSEQAAEYLPKIVSEVAEATTVCNAREDFAELDPTRLTTDVAVKRNQIVTLTAEIVGKYELTTPSRRTRSWLPLVIVALIVGSLVWANNPVGIGSSLINSRHPQAFRPSIGVAAREPDAQFDKDSKNVREPVTKFGGSSDKAAVARETMAAALTGSPVGTAEAKTAQLREAAAAATAELQQKREEAAALMEDLASARRDLATKTALSSKADNEIDRIKKSAEAAASELQQEQKKFSALSNDLASARRDLESSSKTGEELAQLRKAAEAATVQLQEERKRSDALTSDLAAARRKLTTMDIVPQQGRCRDDWNCFR